MMRSDLAGGPPPGPQIEGYRVWRGRRLLHARFIGTMAQARMSGRPWHVVAPTLAELAHQAHPRADHGRWAPW